MSDYYVVVVTNSACVYVGVCDYLHCAHAPAPDGAVCGLNATEIGPERAQ